MLVGSAAVLVPGSRWGTRQSAYLGAGQLQQPTNGDSVATICWHPFWAKTNASVLNVGTDEFFMTLILRFKIIIDVNSKHNWWLGWGRHQDTGASLLGTQQLAVSSAQLGTGIVQGRLWSWSGIPGSVDTEEATRTLNVLESYNMPLVLLPHIGQIMICPPTHRPYYTIMDDK